MSSQYSQQVYALLFGEILGVSKTELLPMSVIAILSSGIAVFFCRPLLLSSFAPELAKAQGVDPMRMELVFLAMLALATALALPVVGALLVFSLLVGPAAAARALTDKPFRSITLSVVLSLLTVWLAIALSYATNWPVGFFVGGFGALFYGAGRLWGKHRA
ncbi:iron chelate uptake ABC transporter family permease subunit [Acerihabitans sp. KWT182]|uniref:Iron chelate uptake ABC transporter family permease subunit n=1 Tax=Acerihabitans sp. KWT182 TaxID=3157919 RepID=A0AAU7QF34_9GAMM